MWESECLSRTWSYYPITDVLVLLAGLMDEIAWKVYEALAYHVTQANFDRRVRTVGLWSLQKTVEAALSAMKTVMQPMSVHLNELQNADPLVEWGNMPT